MSTSSKRKKIPRNFKHKALPHAPDKRLPKTPDKAKPKRAHSFKRSNEKQSQYDQNGIKKYNQYNQIENRSGRAQTFSYTTTKENNGMRMNITYYLDSNDINNSNNTTQIYFNPPSQINNNYTTKPAQKQINNTSIPTRKRKETQHIVPRSSYHKILPLAPTMQNINMEYNYLDKVDLNDNRQGTIRYIGEISVHLKGEIWYGIELNNARGQNDGSLRGQRYFHCKPKYGTFVQKKNIRWLTTDIDNNEEEEEKELEFHINDIVRITGKNGKAQIRCICEMENSVRFGVELLNDMGSHSGTVNGRFYFSCGFYRGLFVEKHKLIRLKHGDPFKDDKKEKIINYNLSTIHIGGNITNDIRTPVMADIIESDSDSDDSVTSTNENADFFEQMELNEEDEHMMFTHILNKLKNVERNAQQSESDEDEEEEEEKDMESDEHKDNDDDNNNAFSHKWPKPNNIRPTYQIPTLPFLKPAGNIRTGNRKCFHPIQSSLTSPASDIEAVMTASFDDIVSKDDPIQDMDVICRIEDNMDNKRIRDINVMATIEDDMDNKPIQDMNVMATIEDDIDNKPIENINVICRIEDDMDQEEEIETPQPETPAFIPPSPEKQLIASSSIIPKPPTPEFIPPAPKGSSFIAPARTSMSITINDIAQPKISRISKSGLSAIATIPIQNGTIQNGTGCNDGISPMLSPLQTPVQDGSLSEEQLNAEFVKYNAENSHLKEFPDSPFDVNTTKREFTVTATEIQLGCNNPHKLFRILHAMVGKLYVNTMKYRSLNANSSRIKAKLLNYEGVEEFFNLLGFQRNEGGNKLKCDLNQPPLSVLHDALSVLAKFIVKTGKKRAMVDRIRKFQNININVDELKTDLLEAENERDTPYKIETPIQQQTFSEMVDKRNNINNYKTEKRNTLRIPQSVNVNYDDIQQKRSKLEIEIDAVFDAPSCNNLLNGMDDDEEECEDDELEGNDDNFKLTDIIHSITHPQNEDDSAISVVLLCYPLFCESTELFKCLHRRFFGCNNDFDQQQKIILFINEWINKYWEQDWISNNELKQVFDIFVDCIIDQLNDDKYQLMVDYLLEIQDIQKTKRNRSQSTVQRSLMYDDKYGLSRINKKLQLKPSPFTNYGQHYDFFKFNNNLIAQQLTIIDFKYYSSITSRECVGQSWKKKNKYEIARNICDSIDHFNRISCWVQARILLCDSTKIRSKIIKKFIKICCILFELRNFQSLHAIYGGLNSSEIMRLKKSWNNVARKYLAKFEEFKVMFSSKKNMANLRKLHRETYPPMIPYIGIYLQDLFQIEEANKNNKTEQDNDGTINFSVLLRLSTTIDSILKYQQIKYKKIKKDINLQKLLLNEFKINQNLSSDIMWKLSNNAKKIDDKKRFGFQ